MPYRRRIYLLLTILLWVLAAIPAGAQGPAGPIRVGLVVKHSDGQVVTRCVSLAKTNPTGLDILRASGLDINVDYSSGIGAAVCALDGQGCTTPGQQCFCQCQGANCAFWNYSYLPNTGTGSAAQWNVAIMGALGRQVAAGDVEGWTWGGRFPTEDGSAGPYTFDQVCAAPAPAPLPTFSPLLATVIPTPTEKSVRLQTAPTETISPATVITAPTETISPATVITAPTETIPPARTITLAVETRVATAGSTAPLANLTATTTNLSLAATLRPTTPALTLVAATPSATSAASPVPVTPILAPSPTSPPVQNSGENDSRLVSYGIFALLVLGLAAILLWTQRR
ncbi:MAG: hypothetical protein EXR62_04170 [Chloroflexi bacterium]|nr:hypothetical protein [Chloroflexota bacterium]